jgi:hypothetical protein
VFKKLAVLIVAVGAVATAQAHAGNGPQFGKDSPPQFNFGSQHDGPPQFGKDGPPPNSWSPLSAPAAAPEIDPASAMSAFTLLAGGLVMLRGRRAAK